MVNIGREVSRTIPDNIPNRLSGGIPILTAYGCVLLERDTGKSCIYTAVNLQSGRREVISRRGAPLTTSGVGTMIEKLRLSSVVGAGRLEADRLFREKITLANCREILAYVFEEILPQHGYAVRSEQIALAEHILEAISRRTISLAEAEVGTGKTLAYLVAAILAKRGRLNSDWNSLYTDAPYLETADMPIVVATSSIALQRALVSNYIPELSDILLEHGVIKTPLTAVIRKGREHYICKRNLLAHILFEHNPKMRSILEGLLAPSTPIDLAEIDGLNAHIKRKISVTGRCEVSCPVRDECPYLRFRGQAGSSTIDIQVCNHNYLLADTLRRSAALRPLIPYYQSIVIDEAHKFLAAARSMYGTELSASTLPEIKDRVYDLKLKHADVGKLAQKTAKKLSDAGKRLFRGLGHNAENNDAEDERGHFTADMDADATRYLRNIRDISDKLIELLASEPTVGNGGGHKAHIIWELDQIRGRAATLTRHGELVCWQERDKKEIRLCAIPKDLDKRLYNDLWSKRIPIVLTSGTLSANGDFSHIKRTLGLARIGKRLTETSKPSPFNYRKNTLLYISEKVPFPNQRDRTYIVSVTDEIERLVYVSHGHAAVLFTSYKAMDMVWEHLENRGLPFPMFRLNKGGIREIERFKKSRNGVLFAAGALWEGIDIPGDALSMLIIVKLPFAVPDPIGEHEQTLYKDMAEYKRQVVVPEMLIKLKQGFGRLIRTESDTGAVAIFDSRAGIGGAYRACVLEALPDCRVTDDIDDVARFIRVTKSPGYFL